ESRCRRRLLANLELIGNLASIERKPMSAESEHGKGQAVFATTHWSVVIAAGDSRLPESAQALERLCRLYWYPLYAYVRRRGHDPDSAHALTQDLYVRLLEKKT